MALVVDAGLTSPRGQKHIIWQRNGAWVTFCNNKPAQPTGNAILEDGITCPRCVAALTSKLPTPTKAKVAS